MNDAITSYEYPSVGTVILIIAIAIVALVMMLGIAHVILCKIERKLGIRPTKKELEQV